MEIAILYREELKEYDFGEGHPFRGDRAEIFPKFLKENLDKVNYILSVRLRAGQLASQSFSFYENLSIIKK